MTNKYEQLTIDLKKAIEESAYIENVEDGGTCNFDSPTLFLPHWNSKKIEEAIHTAELRAFIWNCYGAKHWVLSVPTSGQGNRRTKRAEAIKDALKSLGYSTSMYYQMD